MRALVSTLLALTCLLTLAAGAHGEQKRIPWLTFNEASLDGKHRVLSRHDIFPIDWSLSPTHDKFAHVDYTCDGCPRSNRLMVADVRTGHDELLVQAVHGIADVAWSPDGHSLAFLADGVWVIDADGSDLRRVGIGGSNLVWSPDSKALAFARLDEQLRWHIGVLSVETGDEVALAEGFGPHWSPNGRLLMFETGRTIRTIPATGGVPRTVARGASPAWSPDGKRIAFNRFSHGTTVSLWVVGSRGRGAPRHLGNGAVGASLAPIWSPRSRQIAFRQGPRYCASTLSIVPLDGARRPKRLAAHTRVVTPLAWSKSGRKVLYAAKRCFS